MNATLPISDDKLIAAVQQNPIFEGWTLKELAELREIMHWRAYAEDEVLFAEAEISTYLFVVAEGSFSLQLRNKQYMLLEPGALFGEIGIINNSLRTGTVRAREASAAVAICGTRMFQEEKLRPQLALKLTRALAKKITNYLRTREEITTQELIKQGENDYVEFKSTLRLNLRTGNKDKAMEMAVLKTMAAFLNTKGGTLLIGVEDSGNILGIEVDKFPNHDKYLLHLTNLIKRSISTLHAEYIHFEFIEISGKYILRVDCDAATRPAYVADGENDYFFIRTGPSTTKLRLSRVHEYIEEHFS